MKLEHAKVEKLRSALRVDIPHIGQFNVAIGKNNSGKSTLLSAIQVFFKCLSDGQVVALRPSLGKAIDFTGRDTNTPIEIELRFAITLAERDEILRGIAVEAPQLKNAVDGLDPNLLLGATLSITNEPKHYAYVSKLAFLKPSADTEERIILQVSPSSASELHTKVSYLQKAKDDAEKIATAARRVDQDDWKRLREGGSNLPRPYLLRRLLGDEPSSAVEQRLESLLSESVSFAEFKGAIENEGDRILDSARSLIDEPLRSPLETFSGQETALPKYVLNCLRLIAQTRVLYLSERRKPLGQEEAQRLLALKVRRGGNEALKNIQETVHALLGVHIDAFESATSSGSDKRAEMDVDDFLLEVNGAGIREALRLILDYEFQQPAILLVEEPEVHLHPALEIAMMRFLKQISSSCQVFVSTHSTNFLDAGDLRNVYLVSKERFTSVQLLDLEDAQSQIPKELGLRLSSLFMFDRLVFVEGPSDEAVVREHANKIGVNLAQQNVGFVRMGGVRNFTHYATEAILSFLSKRQVDMYFLLDHDEQDDKDVEAIKKRLGDRANVHVLRKREIENYLLTPSALLAFLEKKTQRSAKFESLSSEPQINELLSSCADELKEFTLGKRVAKKLCRPVYLSESWADEVLKIGAKASIESEIERQSKSIADRSASLAEVYEHESNALSARWEAEKLSLVPGSELLDLVFQKYGVRFRKETDSSRVAAAMTATEVDSELVTFIQTIVR